MRKSKSRVFLLVSFLLLACACRGPYYFDLQTEIPENQEGLKLDKVLLVEDVEINETYRDFRIVSRESPFQVKYHDSASWSKPPDELIQDAVIDFWKKRSVFKKVSIYGSEDDPDLIMKIRIGVMERTLMQKKWFARLAMEMEIADPEKKEILLSHVFDRKLALGKNRIRLLPEKVSIILHEELMKIEAKLLKMPGSK